MSKHRTPEGARVILAPPEWNHTVTHKYNNGCSNCNVLQNLLDGAMAKIKRLQDARQGQQLDQGRGISPTAKMARIWAEQQSEIE